MAINHDTLAKAVFEKETEEITDRACCWKPPVEMQLGDMLYADGFLEVLRPEGLACLPAPWCLLQAREVMLEIKMPGDHCGPEEFQRAILRRAARDVEAFSSQSRLAQCHEPLWFVVPHVPKWLKGAYTLIEVASGCYRVEPWPYPVLWIVANQLPLHPALVTFLVARSGRARMAFIKWSFEQKGPEWVTWLFRGLRFTEKEMANLKEYLNWPKHSSNMTYDPKIVDMFLSMAPDVVKRVTAEATALAIEQGLEQGLGARS